MGSIGAVVPKKREKDLATLLLRLIVNGKDSLDAILAGIHEGSLRESSLKSQNYGFEEGSQYGGLLYYGVKSCNIAFHLSPRLF